MLGRTHRSYAVSRDSWNCAQKGTRWSTVKQFTAPADRMFLRVAAYLKSKNMDMSGIEPDPSRKLVSMLSERDNQLHHMPVKAG